MATSVTIPPEKSEGPPQRVVLSHGIFVLLYPSGEVRIVHPLRSSVTIVDQFGSARQEIINPPAVSLTSVPRATK
jgi:hypothetical protein